MTQSLLELLSPGATHRSDRIYGVVAAVVTNNKDPEKLGRVKVTFPWLSDEDESFWARVATPMAGTGRGAYFLPEVGDEVLVAFEHGDIRFPCVIGALWNDADPPPETNDDEGKNNIRVLKSRSGHVVRLDDTDGEEKIEIVDGGGENSIVISTKDGTIAIAADADITIKSASGTVSLEGNGIEIKSQSGVKVEAGANVDLKASGQLNAKGAMVNIN